MTYGRHRRKPFLNCKNAIPDAGIHGIERDKSVTGGLIIKIERLDEKDLLPLVGFLLLCRDDVSNHSVNDHS